MSASCAPPSKSAVGCVAASGFLRALAKNGLTVKEAEKQLIIRAFKESKGNRTRAAKKIGLARRTFHRKRHSDHLEGF